MYRDFSKNAPDELYCDLFLSTPSLIEGFDGIAGLHVCWSGAEDQAEKILAPIYALGTPIVDSVKSQDYVRIQQNYDNTEPRNNAEYMKAGFINEFTDDLLNKLIDGFEMQEGRSVTVYFQHSGGAIGRVETSSTAFAHRKSIANMLLIVGWPTDDDSAPHIAYLRRYWALLEPATDGYYTVETDDESDSVRHGNYQGNFPRLLEIKRKYDPANLFRLNANIKA